jgi:hypothetical protein
MGSEFIGMADYIVDSIHDLLESGSGMLSDSNSSEGSHHISRECFMAETSDGHVSSANDSDKTPRVVPVRAVVGGARVPPPAAVASTAPQLGRPLMEQLQRDSMNLRKHDTGLRKNALSLSARLRNASLRAGVHEPGPVTFTDRLWKTIMVFHSSLGPTRT